MNDFNYTDMLKSPMDFDGIVKAMHDRLVLWKHFMRYSKADSRPETEEEKQMDRLLFGE